MAIRQDFRFAPVPIRLSCRYLNGITLSYYARAMSLNSRSLRVLSAQPFETGVRLNVVAPFWKSTTECRVAASVRSKKQVSFFELDLKFLQEPALAPAETPVAAVASQPVPSDSTNLTVLAVVAADLADRLEETRFSLAWQKLPAARRPHYLVACVSACMLLLQEKGYLDIRHALRSLGPPPEGFGPQRGVDGNSLLSPEEGLKQ